MKTNEELLVGILQEEINFLNDLIADSMSISDITLEKIVKRRYDLRARLYGFTKKD